MDAPQQNWHGDRGRPSRPFLALHASTPWRLGLTLAMICSTLVSGCTRLPGANRAQDAPLGDVQGVITEVVDGDTVAVQFGSPFDVTETVRLLGIDTPEKPGGPRPAECGGDSASAFTRDLLPIGTTVVLARDRETRDVYGRLLAWVIRANDGTNMNLAIVEAGHATALSIAPNHALRDDVSRAADQARRQQRGFWSECGGLPYPLGSDR